MRHLIVSLLALALSFQASAQPAPPDPLTFNDTHPNSYAIHDAALLVVASHCTTQPCRAMVLVYRALDIIDDNMSMNLGIRAPSSPDPHDRIDRRWRREVMSHPDLFPAVCDTITGLASRYRGDETALDEDIVAARLIELAGSIDGKKGSCVEWVVAAFPQTPDADWVIESAHRDCTAGLEPWTDCKRVAR